MDRMKDSAEIQKILEEGAKMKALLTKPYLTRNEAGELLGASPDPLLDPDQGGFAALVLISNLPGRRADEGGKRWR